MASPVPPYGTVITDALKNPRTALANLIALRDRAKATLRLQGDLPAALSKLDREIARREKAKSAGKS
jgi:hypothetical protein